MLTIRASQIRAIEEDMQLCWLRKYLETSYPRQIAGLDIRALRELISGAVTRARVRGYTSPDTILKYVHVSFLLGVDFEAHPAFAWARQVLDDTDLDLLSERLYSLEEAVIARFEPGAIRED